MKFYGLDTARLFWDRDTDPQGQFLQQEMSNTEGIGWHIVFGHHPYISNGAHGNAGNYEGLGIDPVSGGHIESFFEEHVCGKATVYFSGHDHTRQWLLPQCGTEFIVSGAGAKTTDLEHRDDNPVYYEDDREPGFAWMEILDDRMTVAFYDFEGALDFEKTLP